MDIVSHKSILEVIDSFLDCDAFTIVIDENGNRYARKSDLKKALNYSIDGTLMSINSRGIDNV